MQEAFEKSNGTIPDVFYCFIQYGAGALFQVMRTERIDAAFFSGRSIFF